MMHSHRTKEQESRRRLKQLRYLDRKRYFETHYASNPNGVRRQSTWHRLNVIIGSPRDGRHGQEGAVEWAEDGSLVIRP
jgi:hypothetical protein